MPKTQKRLGRGLSALISVSPDLAAEADTAGQPDAPPSPTTVPAGQIRPNPFQPRRDLDPAQLESLAESIRQNGLVQPIVVRRTGEQLYELIVGERRWRASQMAGLADVPAVVRDASDEQMLELALVENIFREDLNAIDRALAYRRYSDEFSLSAEDVASRLGEDRSTVANYLRLLDLPNEVKQWVAEGKLAMGHARCLLAIKSPSELTQVARQTINLGLSVRALEKLVRDRVAARKAASQPASEGADGKRPQIRHLEQLFTEQLGTKVEIRESRRKGSGKIIMDYYSLDDFDRLAERLGVDRSQ